MGPPDTVVVLAAGLGRRMRRDGPPLASPVQEAAAARGAKALMPLGPHTFLDHLLTALAEAGLSRALLVVPPDHAAFTAHFEAWPPARLSLDYAIQPQPRGTADAVLAACRHLPDEPFLVVNGDNYYPPAAIAAVREAGAPAMGGFTTASLLGGGVLAAERLSGFAFAWRDARGHLARLVEKPGPVVLSDPTALVSMNLWAFTPLICQACERVRPSVRGELELVDAVRVLTDDLGAAVRVVEVEGPVFDLSQREDVRAVEEMLARLEVRR